MENSSNIQNLFFGETKDIQDPTPFDFKAERIKRWERKKGRKN